MNGLCESRLRLLSLLFSLWCKKSNQRADTRILWRSDVGCGSGWKSIEDWSDGSVRRTTSAIPERGVTARIRSRSDDKRYPAKAHLLHVCSVLRVFPKESFLDDTLQ
jgi:hypothetical protein